MTTISQTTAFSEASLVSSAANRVVALDRARTFLVLLVLIHHAVIPYTYLGHTDRQSFLGFDGIVIFTDSFFMATMFFLSGAFVWPCLQRKGALWFLRDRWWRLGLPFMVCALLVMPLAYYAVELRQHDIGFTAYWWKTVTVGPWPSGPVWFVWVLLALDVAAAVVFWMAPGLIESLSRLSQTGFTKPGVFFAALLGASIVAYVPLVLYFDASRWFTIGPVAIQASRILLYLVYFLAGIAAGAIRFEWGLLSRDGEMAQRWPAWLGIAALSFGCMIGLLHIRYNMPDFYHPPLSWRIGYALAFVSFSAATTFSVLAISLRMDNGSPSILDPLRDSSYGIFLIHYLPVLWLQYWLFDISLAPVMQLTAILKSIIVFVLALALSWAATLALRKIPGATFVL